MERNAAVFFEFILCWFFFFSWGRDLCVIPTYILLFCKATKKNCLPRGWQKRKGVCVCVQMEGPRETMALYLHTRYALRNGGGTYTRYALRNGWGPPHLPRLTPPLNAYFPRIQFCLLSFSFEYFLSLVNSFICVLAFGNAEPFVVFCLYPRNADILPWIPILLRTKSRGEGLGKS